MVLVIKESGKWLRIRWSMLELIVGFYRKLNFVVFIVMVGVLLIFMYCYCVNFGFFFLIFWCDYNDVNFFYWNKVLWNFCVNLMVIFIFLGEYVILLLDFNFIVVYILLKFCLMMDDGGYNVDGGC